MGENSLEARLDRLVKMNSPEFRKQHALEAKSRGKKVLGSLCSYVPEEVVYAAGMFPWRITGTWDPDLSLAAVYRDLDSCRYCTHALEALLRSVRGAYGVSPWSRDMLLDAAARSVLRREAEPAEALSRLGAGPDAQGWRCDGTTAADCLAQIVWDPRSRHALLAESNSMMGLAASLTEQGVSAALLVAEP